MTNKEKRQYLADLSIYGSEAYTSEIQRFNEFKMKMPKTLYKFLVLNFLNK